MAEDWNDAIVIPYDKPQQAFAAGNYFGLALAVELLKDLPETVRKLPGYVLCVASMEARCQAERANMSILSMKFAAKNGIDLATHMVASYPEGLRALPLDLAQMAEEA